MYSFPNLEPVHCSMSGSNCCFLTCIQVSQEAGQVVFYSHHLKNFPWFAVIHTVKGFSVGSQWNRRFFSGILLLSLIQCMLVSVQTSFFLMRIHAIGFTGDQPSLVLTFISTKTFSVCWIFRFWMNMNLGNTLQCSRTTKYDSLRRRHWRVLWRSYPKT